MSKRSLLLALSLVVAPAQAALSYQDNSKQEAQSAIEELYQKYFVWGALSGGYFYINQFKTKDAAENMKKLEAHYNLRKKEGYSSALIHSQEGLYKGKRENYNDLLADYFDYDLVVSISKSKEGMDDILKERSVKAHRLIDLYKIHLMPQKGQAWAVLRLITQLVSEQQNEIGNLIDLIKIKENPDELKKDEAGNVFPIIVIYPNAKKESAETLLSHLVTWFKKNNVHGAGIVPRFNIGFKDNRDLMYYAQGDADDKYQDHLKEYFDPETNYALYTKDFTGEVRDYHLNYNNV